MFVPLPDCTTLDKQTLRFVASAETYGLTHADYGYQVCTGRELFGIAGIALRRSKYPVSAERIPDGQGFKSTTDQVALLLQKGIRDLTPKGH